MVNIATQDDDETVSFWAKRFDLARGATIYTLNLPDELASHASAASDLARLCTLARRPACKQAHVLVAKRGGDLVRQGIRP